MIGPKDEEKNTLCRRKIYISGIYCRDTKWNRIAIEVEL